MGQVTHFTPIALEVKRAVGSWLNELAKSLESEPRPLP